VIALKGGSGKTTIATHMALAAHLRGLKTLVADIDPQRSATEVLQARVGEGPRCIGVTGPNLFATQLAAVGSGTDLMVVDTAAGAIEDVTHAIVLADVSLLVVRPTLLDIGAAVRTVDIIKRLKKPALVVVSQAPPSRDGVEPPTVKRALRALAFIRLPVVPTIIRSRAIYQSALETGKSAEECFDVNAAHEMGELWTFVDRFVFGKRDRPAPPRVIEDEDLRCATD
jgi:chromosome partitioning protein